MRGMAPSMMVTATDAVRTASAGAARTTARPGHGNSRGPIFSFSSRERRPGCGPVAPARGTVERGVVRSTGIRSRGRRSAGIRSTSHGAIAPTVHAATADGPSFDGVDGIGGNDGKASFLAAFWKFLRPHTIRGTILGSLAVTSKAIMENPAAIDWGLLPRALLGVLALLCGNGYIVGINQIYDVEIDAVNKPFLPMAAGELGFGQAWGICVVLAAAGLGITTFNFGSLIAKLYAFGLFLGTIYSVPPLRLKKSAVAAFAIIATVRGFLLNFGVYHATRAALGLPFVWSPPIAFITVFVTVFAIVIAITKDLPDVEGDKRFGIETFATRLGVRNIAALGSGLLVANYMGAIALAVRMPHAFNAAVMIPFHALYALLLVATTIKLDRGGYSREGIAGYYRFIWYLFYGEYALLPFI